jgi:hypothetical protein
MERPLTDPTGGPMPPHQPTPADIEAMTVARRRLREAIAAAGPDHELDSPALADAAEAAEAFHRAVRVVLYGSPDGPQQPRTGSAYELSSPLAQQHWPSPPPAPGG